MAPIQNRLLKKLSPEDSARMLPTLELVDLAAKDVLLRPDEVIDYVYFLESGVVSVLAMGGEERPIEVGMFGAEGMSNFVVRPGDKSYFLTQVMLPGRAWRLDAKRFGEALKALPTLMEVVLRYKDAIAVQFGYTAFANGVFTLEERLARSILMAHDRAGGDQLRIVHDTFAGLMSVRRSGVTTAMHVLEGELAIKAVRGIITVRDRDKLVELAGSSYGRSERAYEELMDY
jgi:CRP-like cAMP-binding protein